jgi:NitT/TauT family transport system permease protein
MAASTVAEPKVSEVATSHTPSRGWLRFAEPAAVILVLLGLWELCSRVEVIPQRSMPPVTVILQSFVEDVQHTEIWSAVLATMGAWAIGLVVVVLVAVPLGLVLGMSSVAYRAVVPTLDFVRTIPSIAALPVLLFLYGVGIRLIVTLVVLAAVWPLLIQTIYGAHDIDPVSRDTARVYGLGRVASFFRVTLPGSMPYIVTGLRISAVVALLVAVGASLIIGGAGLGEQIWDAQRNGLSSLMYARILLASLLGLAVTFGLVAIERRVLQWHPTYRGAAV